MDCEGDLPCVLGVLSVVNDTRGEDQVKGVGQNLPFVDDTCFKFVIMLCSQFEDSTNFRILLRVEMCKRTFLFTNLTCELLIEIFGLLMLIFEKNVRWCFD